MRLYEIAHQIEHLLFSIDVTPEHRLDVIDYLKAGFDSETGGYMERPVELQVTIRCLDCEHLGGPCPDDCEVKRLLDSD